MYLETPTISFLTLHPAVWKFYSGLWIGSVPSFNSFYENFTQLSAASNHQIHHTRHLIPQIEYTEAFKLKFTTSPSVGLLRPLGFCEGVVSIVKVSESMDRGTWFITWSRFHFTPDLAASDPSPCYRCSGDVQVSVWGGADSTCALFTVSSSRPGPGRGNAGKAEWARGRRPSRARGPHNLTPFGLGWDKSSPSSSPITSSRNWVPVPRKQIKPSGPRKWAAIGEDEEGGNLIKPRSHIRTSQKTGPTTPIRSLSLNQPDPWVGRSLGSGSEDTTPRRQELDGLPGRPILTCGDLVSKQQRPVTEGPSWATGAKGKKGPSGDDGMQDSYKWLQSWS